MHPHRCGLQAWLFIKMTWRKVSSGEMSSGSWVVLLITCFIVAMVYTAKEISNKIQRFRALPDKVSDLVKGTARAMLNIWRSCSNCNLSCRWNTGSRSFAPTLPTSVGA